MPRTPYRNTYGEGGGIRTHDLNLIRRETGRIRDSNPGPQGDKEVLLPTELPPRLAVRMMAQRWFSVSDFPYAAALKHWRDSAEFRWAD